MDKLIYAYNLLVGNIIALLNQITTGKNTRFLGCFSAKKHKNSTIKIGDNTIINSMNRGYHINMHSPCKLYTNREGAEITIGKNCRIHGTCINAEKKVQIGDNCLVAANTHIIDSNGHVTDLENPENRLKERDSPRDIIIGNNVWIAANCIILKGTTIGDGTIITAGSVVKGNIPGSSIYGGNPAIRIK